ncbi:acyl carrier protein [Marinospirillum perlucidum]|uniref:acyl carrier protein n=1 Tax=Marinospirillum perlucidum TaxID=1982602 RepID=UPI001C49BD33|nr:acyl carrier protein [Marinospirillum perlucidum]
MTNTEKLQQTFATALAIDINRITDELAYNSIKEWDSTAHMILVAELEATFDILLDTDDIIDMSSVAESKRILAKYDLRFD